MLFATVGVRADETIADTKRKKFAARAVRSLLSISAHDEANKFLIIRIEKVKIKWKYSFKFKIYFLLATKKFTSAR